MSKQTLKRSGNMTEIVENEASGNERTCGHIFANKVTAPTQI